jgi:coproporphyrinogen III oxidase
MQKMFNVGEAVFACGLSLVLHPKTQWHQRFMPTGVISKCTMTTGNVIQQWFGGQDLTPYYLFEEDAIHFHQTCKTTCDKHNLDFIRSTKKQCDAIWNAHRNEARGFGGLFSHKDETEIEFFLLTAYVPIVEKEKILPYTTEQRTWQEIRRGRYVEFNLVHDKGTLFGLKPMEE